MLIKEQNAIRKNWFSDKIKIGLVYPNKYRIAMTSLGIQLLYFLFNSWENFLCERIFKPIDKNIAPYSLENQKQMEEFNILAVSCQFEHDYIQTIELLNKTSINPDVRKRGEEDPLKIVGGPSPTANPFPVLFLADAFFLGDVEPIVELLKSALEESTKKRRLEELANIPGFMVFGYHYDNKGNWIGNKIEVNKVKNFKEVFYPTKQIIPLNVKGTRNEPVFGKAFYLETDRGCSERCMFCFVGHCRFPRIPRSLKNLTKIIDEASELNDFDKIVIYGSAVAQSGVLDELINYIVAKGYEVSCSSFRADFITENLLEALKKGKQRTIALAPETGDEKLRIVLNKKMTDKSIFDTVKLIWDLGFRHLKLYMMYGFPLEKDEIKHSNYKFVKNLREKYFKTGKINVSMNQFITKANTPFQYTNMIDIKESKNLQKWYKKSLYQIKNINLSLYAPEWAVIQRILSLRGQSYFYYISEIGKIGGSVGNWKKTLKKDNKSLSDEAIWKYKVEDNLPWDNINHSLGKKILVSSYKKYISEVQKI